MVIGHTLARREDVLVVCPVSVCTSCYILPFLIMKTSDFTQYTYILNYTKIYLAMHDIYPANNNDFLHSINYIYIYIYIIATVIY